nr:uncharacterized protein LOC124497544 [Dermatophagoides farinae]
MDPNETSSNQSENYVNNENEEEEDDDDDEEIRKIKIALEMNQMLTEQFKWKRQKIQQLQDLDFRDNEYDDDDDNDDESSTNSVRNLTHLEKRNSTMFLTKFYKPYLRDDRGFSAPNLFNPEHEYVLDTRIQMCLHHQCPVRNWKTSEIKIIRNEVQSQNLFKQTRSIVKRIEELLVLKARTAEQTEEVNRLNSELAMKRLSQEEPERFCPQIDWLAIAKLCENEDRNENDYELYYNNYLHSSVNRNEWTEDEDVRLKELIEKYGENNWDQVAAELSVTGSHRLAWQCCSRYQSRHSKSMHMTGPIEGEEAEKLSHLIELARTNAGEVDWKYVFRVHEGRRISQIKHFNNQQLLESSNWKRWKRWTQLEDTIIFAAHKYYQNYIEKNEGIYVKIAQHLPNRTNRQIRERYTMILSQQRQQRGDWKLNDDMKLMLACADDLRVDGKIDYIRLNRNHFPYRNAHQLFHRVRLLTRYIPSNFFQQQPINEKQLMECLQTVKTKRLSWKQISQPKLPKNSMKLLNYIRKLSDIQQMIIDGKHNPDGQNDDENSTSGDNDNDDNDNDDNDDDDDDDDDDDETTTTMNLPTALTVLTRPNDDNCEQQWTIDSCIQLYKHLKPLANFFQRRCIYDSNSDLHCADMIRTVLRELLDPDISNDITEVTPSVDYDQTDDYDDGDSVNPSSLDTLRFYLATTSVSINQRQQQQQQQQQFNEIRSLFLPNYSTTYAYVLMQFLYNAMFIHSVENQYQMMNNDDNNDDNVEYQKLRTIFLSLFLWPALLSRLRPDNNCSDERLQQSILRQSSSSSSRIDDSNLIELPDEQQQQQAAAATINY